MRVGVWRVVLSPNVRSRADEQLAWGCAVVPVADSWGTCVVWTIRRWTSRATSRARYGIRAERCGIRTATHARSARECSRLPDIWESQIVIPILHV
jgi:hypothetical protein